MAPVASCFARFALQLGTQPGSQPLAGGPDIAVLGDLHCPGSMSMHSNTNRIYAVIRTESMQWKKGNKRGCGAGEVEVPSYSQVDSA